MERGGLLLDAQLLSLYRFGFLNPSVLGRVKVVVDFEDSVVMAHVCLSFWDHFVAASFLV